MKNSVLWLMALFFPLQYGVSAIEKLAAVNLSDIHLLKIFKDY